MIKYYALAVLSVFLYLYSFFSITKLDSPKTIIEDNVLNNTEKPPVNRLVLIVIDALRHDFVSHRRMPHLYHLSAKHGCSALVKVEAPTVTLPRIKALTTGRIPQFIDVVLNLIKVDSVKDSFLHRAVENGKKIVFYGDDTWLKMYPDMFVRSEGTSSFYVNDHTEVDYNVTRNVRKELMAHDWDIMILHYLGLDHIGHTHGPYSSLISKKLMEMDEIVKKIYNEEKYLKTLIVVTGDHGMKDSGGHGGTTYSETRVPLLLTGVKCSNDSIDQIDIPMVISALMGFKFPRNSIGKISSKLLESLSPEKLLSLYRYNVLQLQDADNGCGDEFTRAQKLHKEFLKTKDLSLIDTCIKSYQNCLEDLNSKLVKSSVEQYDAGMVIACSVMIFCLTSTILSTQSSYKTKFYDNAMIFFLVFITLVINLNSFFLTIFILLIFAAVLYQFIIGVNYINLNIKPDVIAFLALHVIHGLALVSSSFIEEEHQIFYFFLSSLFMINIILSAFTSKFSIFVSNITVLVLFRIVRKLNQTGDKWAFLPDIAQFLMHPNHFMYLSAMHILGLFLTFIVCMKITKSQTKDYFSLVIVVLIFIFKMHLPDSSTLGKLIWLVILINFVFLSRSLPCIESIIVTWILISVLLVKPHNVILVPFLYFSSHVISTQFQSKEAFIMANLWLGNALFFCQGHSNSFANIDIAVGFIGLSDYVPHIVALQVLCHTYALPILSHFLVLRKYNDVSSLNVFVLSRIWILTITFIITFTLRHHLFIWSVFAPKLLIESSHTIVLFIEMVIYCLVNASHSLICNKESIKS